METTMSTSDEKEEHWMNSKWRPMMGWMYMTVCSMDFIIFPILWSLLQAISHGQINSQWQPLTLQGAGLFHIAMGAVLGIAAYGRTREKISGAENGGFGQLEGFGPGSGTTYVPPNATSTVSISNQAAPNFGNNNSFASSSMNNTTAFGGPATSSNTNSFAPPAPTFAPPAPTFAPPAPTFAPPAPTFAPPAPTFGSKPVGPSQAFPEK
jgi:hypothetical protein